MATNFWIAFFTCITFVLGLRPMAAVLNPKGVEVGALQVIATGLSIGGLVLSLLSKFGG